MRPDFTKQEAREALCFSDLLCFWELVSSEQPGLIEFAALGLICDLSAYLRPDVRDTLFNPCVLEPLEEDEHE